MKKPFLRKIFILLTFFQKKGFNDKKKALKKTIL